MKKQAYSDDLRLYRGISLEDAEAVLEKAGFERVIEELHHKKTLREKEEPSYYQLWFREPGLFFKISSSFLGGVDSGKLVLQVAHRGDPDEAPRDAHMMLGLGSSTPLFRSGVLEETQEGRIYQRPDYDSFYGRAVEWGYESALGHLGAVLDMSEHLEIMDRWDPWKAQLYFLNDPTAYMYEKEKGGSLYSAGSEEAPEWMQKNFELSIEHGIDMADFQKGRRLLLLPHHMQCILLHTLGVDNLVETYEAGIEIGIRDGRRPHPGKGEVERAREYIKKHVAEKPETVKRARR